MKAYERVLEHVEAGILDGSYRVGSLLPAERDLAARLEVSRTAVREALRTLQAQGIIESSVGAGDAGGTRIAGRHSPALATLLRLHVALGRFPRTDVVDLRVLIECEAVGVLARRVDPGDAATLREVVERQGDPGLDLRAFNELDTEFHTTLAGLAGNQLVTDLVAAVRESIAREVRDAASHHVEWADFRAAVLEQHAGIVDAVSAGDVATAQQRIDEHIRRRWSDLLGS
ncbi:MAG TPA: FCD domain-containing protein [Propionibacteriaceae bacterium]|nr:FCD domain-containing protein [Propionibacteriaceae bacterium]